MARSSGRMRREPRLSKCNGFFWGGEFSLQTSPRNKMKQLLNHFIFSMHSPCFLCMDVPHRVSPSGNRRSTVHEWDVFLQCAWVHPEFAASVYLHKGKNCVHVAAYTYMSGMCVCVSVCLLVIKKRSRDKTEMYLRSDVRVNFMLLQHCLRLHHRSKMCFFFRTCVREQIYIWFIITSFFLLPSKFTTSPPVCWTPGVVSLCCAETGTRCGSFESLIQHKWFLVSVILRSDASVWWNEINDMWQSWRNRNTLYF